MGEGKTDRLARVVVLVVIWVVWLLFLFIMGTSAEGAARKGSPAGASLIFLSWVSSIAPSILLILVAIPRKSSRLSKGVMFSQIFLVISVLCVLTIFSVHISSIPYPFQAGGSYANAALSGAYLSARDLCGVNFSGADLAFCNACETNLGYADLANANMKGADMRRANLTGANLAYANLEGADLSGADLTEAKLDDVSLVGAKLVGMIGISDEILASALRVSLDNLPFTLSQKGIRLENRESIFQSLKGIDFSLEGVDESGAYTSDKRFHPVMLLNERGEPHSWCDRIREAGFEPMALRFCELVVVVEEENAVAIEVREYVYEFTGLPAPSVTRYQCQMHVCLYAARTGGVIADTTFQGSLPGPCPERASVGKTEIYGGHVGEGDVLDWLYGFVNP